VADGGTAVAETDIVAGGNEVLPARQVDTSDVVVDDSVSGTGDVVVAEEGVGQEVESFETAQGSVYTVLPDGRTQRFKTATQEQNEPQDLIVFAKFENPQQEQDFLSAQNREDGQKLYVVDSEGNVYNKNEEIKGKDVRLAIIKDGKVVQTVETSLTPKIGYNTFDQRRYEENGEKFRSTHLGNKVTKINTKTETATSITKEQTDAKARIDEFVNGLETVNPQLHKVALQDPIAALDDLIDFHKGNLKGTNPTTKAYAEKAIAKFEALKKDFKLANSPAQLGQEVVDAPAENVAPEIKQKIDDYIVQLEKDKKLQIKCPPGMTWKAKKGMQSGFTKGGKWEVLTKFNGKSHEMGGIDIELGGGKFKMSNKNGEFKAKFGLVIPCKK
jgi:hypothetical protein